MALPSTLASQSTNGAATSAWANGVKSWVDFLANPPCARVFHNAAQSIANTTFAALAFNSERYDVDTMHSTVTNTSRLTCNTPGLYHLEASVEFAGNATNTRQAMIRLNGTTYIARSTSPGVTVDQSLVVSCDYRLSATDYVELVVWQNSGGALNIQSTGNYSPEFSARWVGI